MYKTNGDKIMNEYHVAYDVVYSEIVLARSPEEAAEIVAQNCPYDIDSSAWVTNEETGEEFEI